MAAGLGAPAGWTTGSLFAPCALRTSAGHEGEAQLCSRKRQCSAAARPSALVPACGGGPATTALLAGGGTWSSLSIPAAAAAAGALLALRGIGGARRCRARQRWRLSVATGPALPKVVAKAEAATIEKKTLTERQQQFWEMLAEDLEDDVVPAFGKEALSRVYEFIKYCKYEKEIPMLPEFQEVDPEFFPELRAKPWWDAAECGEWIEKVKAGLPYVQGELADLLEDNEKALISDSVQNYVMGNGWSGFRLQRLGDWLPKNCKQFPQTVQLLKEAKVPLAMRGVIVARQVPGTGVAPHSDGRNIFLTAHFGLSVPEDCDITVGGETRSWIEDGVVVFDTSFVHSTRNSSTEDRFVLIVDFWHPDLTEAEKEALEFIYDFRTKFEQGKIKYLPKMPTDFFKTLEMYSAWGGAYTEEKVVKPESSLDNTLGGFML